MNDRFSVTLSFGNVPESIVVPFEAIKTFVDPSVEFGLRFDAHDEDELGDDEDEADEAESPDESHSPDEEKPGEEGQVVSLDKWRKH